MFNPADLPSRLAKSLLRRSSLPALGTLVGMLLIALFVTWQNHNLAYEQSRADVLKEVSVVRARLEGHINGNLQLVRGFVAAIETEPEMRQPRFAELAARLLQNPSQIRNIAAAPNMVVSMMYPMTGGNDRVMGYDYRLSDDQRAAAERAEQSGELVLAGPLNLVQGGVGFIGRFPVFIGGAEQRQFWGIVSAVMDAERLYRESGLYDGDLGIEIAITGRDGLISERGVFFGHNEVLQADPVVAEIVLPSGSWQIAAVPRGGWSAMGGSGWFVSIGFLLLAAVVTIPVFLAGRLMDERQRTLKALRSREAELQRVSRRLGLALETSEVGVFEFDIQSGELLWDDRVNALFGLPRDGGTRRHSDWAKALHPEDRARAEEEFRVAVEITGHYRSEYRIVTPWNEVRNVRAIATVYKDESGRSKVVGVNWDVSTDVALNENLKAANRLTEARNFELEAAKASIEHNALHDSLTALPNRRYLDQVLRERAERAASEGQTLSLLHIDLDRFKQINDTLGHAAGDAMLVHASKVLKANIRGDDFVARIGGDEFVLVSICDGSEAAMARLADRIIGRMRQPVTYEGHECRIGVSVGIAMGEGPEIDANKLLINADIALYRAKSRGRNRYEFFTEALQAEVIRTKTLADEILHGIEHHEFVAHFQPQFDAVTHEVVGMEALARWQHPREGLLGPAHFLDVAEDLNVVATLDRIVLEQALAARAGWLREGFDVPRVSVNVSARRLQDEQLVASLRELQIAPGTVSFELVESIFLEESDDAVLWTIDQIKELGIDIEIDDFGTGYASIVSLMKLKPRRLKIDRQLVQPIVTSPGQRHLVESIVEIGKSLSIEVVGEGVETMEHAAILRDLGCAVLQGFALSRPLSREAISGFLASWKPAPSPRQASGG